MSSLIQLINGKLYDVFNPDASVLDEQVVAYGLANKGRFSGQSLFYSVAQHSVLVSYLCPREIAYEGLMHDAAESVLGDVPTPIKHSTEFSFFRELEEKNESAFVERFKLSPEKLAQVKMYDKLALAIEAIDLMDARLKSHWKEVLNEFGLWDINSIPWQAEKCRPGNGLWGPPTFPGKDHLGAKSQFLYRYYELCPQ